MHSYVQVAVYGDEAHPLFFVSVIAVAWHPSPSVLLSYAAPFLSLFPVPLIELSLSLGEHSYVQVLVYGGEAHPSSLLCNSCSLASFSFNISKLRCSFSFPSSCAAIRSFSFSLRVAK